VDRRPLAVFSRLGDVDNTRLYFVTLLNGLTLASLYFIVASGFTLVFGLMRNVNLAHGSLYCWGLRRVHRCRAHRLVGAGRRRRLRARAVAGLLIQVLFLRHMQGEELRQTMVTIGLSIVIADLLLMAVHRPGPPDGSARVAAGTDPRHPADQRLFGLPAEPARFRPSPSASDCGCCSIARASG
jgi:branched-subunit amino acid ABC-type transport system permease component